MGHDEKPGWEPHPEPEKGPGSDDDDSSIQEDYGELPGDPETQWPPPKPSPSEEE
jgi:hypothetical protein